MNITSKFNVGEKLVTIDKRTLKVREFEVESVCAITTENGTSISYRAKGDSPFSDSIGESVVFATKEELMAYING